MSHNRIGTVTAVRPIARFGELAIEKESVVEFKEKPNFQQGWINGGFFVFKKDLMDYIPSTDTMLENTVMEKLIKSRQLSAFQHTGFWHCMDTKRDVDFLNNYCRDN